MKKFTLALALGAGLVLSLAGPSARASAIVQLTPETMSASQFSSDFAPINPVTSGPMATYGFMNTSNAGTVESQVFQGSGPFAGLYAYAYQFSVGNTTDSTTNQPTSMNSASMLFNATPTAAFVINSGQIGSLSVPQAAAGNSPQAPSSITYLPGTNTGSLTFQYLNASTNSGPLAAGAVGEPIVVLTNQAPGQNQYVYVSVQNPEPQTGYPQVYAPGTGSPTESPAPEPATILAWAGVLSALAVARHVRRGRQAD